MFISFRVALATALPIGPAAQLITTFSLLLPVAASLEAQSLLERPPNVSGNWVAPVGTVQFNFVHRFVRTQAPLRKITNFPTFVIGVGLPKHTQVGFLYSTNSTLVPSYPNEWEFYGRWLPLSQDRGAPFDLGGQVGYNLAVKGLDGEISIARGLGPVRLIGVTRLLDDPTRSGHVDVALGGGLVFRLQRYIALAGDLVTLTQRDSVTGEKPAWSAGVHVAIPGTPHTLSIEATNTSTVTLEGASRGTSQRRYGFEFTIPFTLARYFGKRQPAPPPAAPPGAAPGAPGDTSAAARTGATVKASMKNIAFQPSRIEITTGTTVEWTNNDAVDHTVTAIDRSFDSGNLAPGATWRYTFTKPGTYQIFCVVHPFMKGVVIVKQGIGKPQPAPPAAAPPGAPKAPGDTSAAARTGPTVKASMKSIAFQPSRIEITAGTTVEWTNDDAVEHTVTANDRSFDSGNMAPGATWRYTFSKSGTYQILCVVHPFMKGVVVVKEGK